MEKLLQRGDGSVNEQLPEGNLTVSEGLVILKGRGVK